jgi:hypothetical protein
LLNRFSVNTENSIRFLAVKNNTNTNVKIKAEGDIQSLLGFSDTCSEYSFNYLFKYQLLTSAPELSATKLRRLLLCQYV